MYIHKYKKNHTQFQEGYDKIYNVSRKKYNVKIDYE